MYCRDIINSTQTVLVSCAARCKTEGFSDNLRSIMCFKRQNEVLKLTYIDVWDSIHPPCHLHMCIEGQLWTIG